MKKTGVFTPLNVHRRPHHLDEETKKDTGSSIHHLILFKESSLSAHLTDVFFDPLRHRKVTSQVVSMPCNAFCDTTFFKFEDGNKRCVSIASHFVVLVFAKYCLFNR